MPHQVLVIYTDGQMIVDEELLQSLDYDKYLHYKYGFILCLFFSLFTNKAFKIVSFLARLKEFIDGLGFGTKDENDYLATMKGASFALEFIKKYFNRG